MSKQTGLKYAGVRRHHALMPERAKELPSELFLMIRCTATATTTGKQCQNLILPASLRLFAPRMPVIA